MFYSLGGGTGSGLGSRLLEELRDSRCLMACAILPMVTGENPMQCYNVLLALNWLQDLSDGLLLYENDQLLSQVELGSLQEMNQVVARDLVPHLCPADRLSELSELQELTRRGQKVLQAYSGELKSLLRLPKVALQAGRAVLRGHGELEPLLQRLTGCDLD